MNTGNRETEEISRRKYIAFMKGHCGFEYFKNIQQKPEKKSVRKKKNRNPYTAL